jgi:16S rRNA (cytidine1402-2'-O)-methyltransferase
MTDSPDSPAPQTPPGIYLVGTPIGNMEDITLRALRVLARADVLACEDTRVTRKLFARHGIPAPKTLVACNDHNERVVAKHLANMAAEGKVVAYCSDAGMPGVSDPGFALVREARERGVPVDVIPGPSAVATAVALSGVAASLFTFFGFPPRRDGRVAAIFRRHGGLRPAMVFYESPRRVGRLLAIAAETLGGDRDAAVCFELTKKFQRVERGMVGELAARFAAIEPRGEAVVIVAGAEKDSREDAEDEQSGEDTE